jgi:hypothetical protein
VSDVNPVDPNDPRIAALNSKLETHTRVEKIQAFARSDITKSSAAIVVAGFALAGLLCDSLALKASASLLGMALPATYLLCVFALPLIMRAAVRTFDPDHKRKRSTRLK